MALERVPVREHTELQDASGHRLGEVTSGLLGPTIDQPIAMGYVPPAFAALGTRGQRHGAWQGGADAGGCHAFRADQLFPRLSFFLFFCSPDITHWSFPMTIKYTPDHEWIKIDGNSATVGITHHAQDALGDVVFVDLPEVGKTLRRQRRSRRGGVGQGRRRCVHARQRHVVTEVNEALRADPALANSDPLGAGWFFKDHAGPTRLSSIP
jgi:glycine cleavage system H protein